MHRLRQASPSVFFFLVFLLHCSQTCLAAGHARAAVTVPASTNHGSEHVPCHSPQTAPQGSPARCPDCTDHVFLKSVAAGTETLAAAGPGLFSLCLLTHSVLPTLPHSRASVLRLDSTALSPPRYLTLSVLRL